MSKKDVNGGPCVVLKWDMLGAVASDVEVGREGGWRASSEQGAKAGKSHVDVGFHGGVV